MMVGQVSEVVEMSSHAVSQPRVQASAGGELSMDCKFMDGFFSCYHKSYTLITPTPNKLVIFSLTVAVMTVMPAFF